MPAKFSIIENATDFLDDLEHKRLTKTERAALNEELTKLLFAELVDDARSKGIMRDILKEAHPVSVACISNRDHLYYVIQFSNKVELKCSHKQYNSAPVKKQIKRLY
jgi:hypothetical protein